MGDHLDLIVMAILITMVTIILTLLDNNLNPTTLTKIIKAKEKAERAKWKRESPKTTATWSKKWKKKMLKKAAKTKTKKKTSPIIKIDLKTKAK